MDYAVRSYGISQRRACRLLQQNRNICFYRSVRDPRLELRTRMREIAHTRVRYGYRRVHILLRRDGWTVGKKLVYRLYREEQFQLRSKRPKRRRKDGEPGRLRAPIVRGTTLNSRILLSAV